MIKPIFVEKASDTVYTYVREGMTLTPYKRGYKEIKTPKLLVYQDKRGTEIFVPENAPYFRRDEE